MASLFRFFISLFRTVRARRIQIRRLWMVCKCLRIEIRLLNSDTKRAASTRGRNISIADWSCVVNKFCPLKLHNYSRYLINCTTCFFFLLEGQLWCSHEWICSRRRLGPRVGVGWGGGIKIQTSDSDYGQNYNFILKILRSESWMKRSEFQNPKIKSENCILSWT